MWVNESTGRGGEQEIRTRAMLEWAGSEGPAVIEGEKQDYKLQTSHSQRLFLNQPAVSLHICFSHLILCFV